MTPPLFRERLTNGLRVTIAPDMRAPLVAVNLWYHVGSAMERAGRTGFAHLFEHMLFQGSAHVDANGHFDAIQRVGGTLNGSTWLERTNYFETVPSHELALALWLEADRMGQLLPAMTQAKLDTQRDVVKNERRWSVDNQPYGTWWEQLPALCYPPTHPYHHSLIGSMEDLSAATLDDVRAFFETWYAPDNAVLTIVGDVDVDATRALVAEHFGSIRRAGAVPARPDFTLRDDATTAAPRTVTIPDRVPLSRVLVAMRIPPLTSPEHAIADVVAAALATRRGSRLYRALQRDAGCASATSAFTWDLSAGADLFVADATAQSGTDVDALSRALHAELDRMHATPLTRDELARATTVLATERASALATAQGRADAISQAVTYFDDPAWAFTREAAWRAVDVAAAQAFVARWLTPSARFELRYVPSEGAA
ncbi:MAG: insulinase family protein [Gemmatimonadaceae bacterium]|nr:insulinase family protein [Gemmatimonadaceae bacterium]